MTQTKLRKLARELAKPGIESLEFFDSEERDELGFTAPPEIMAILRKYGDPSIVVGEFVSEAIKENLTRRKLKEISAETGLSLEEIRKGELNNCGDEFAFRKKL